MTSPRDKLLFELDTSILNENNFPFMYKNFLTKYDTPEPWGLFFQDNATPQMEALEELHNNIMFYLAIIMFAVTWIFISITLNYTKSRISNKYMNHGTLVELIWTITPALILILIIQYII